MGAFRRLYQSESSGKREVTRPLGYDESGRVIFFSGVRDEKRELDKEAAA